MKFSYVSLLVLLTCSVSMVSAKEFTDTLVAAGSGVIAGAFAPVKTITELTHYVVGAADKIAGDIHDAVGINVYSRINHANKLVYVAANMVPASLAIYWASHSKTKNEKICRWAIAALVAYPALFKLLDGVKEARR